MQNEFEKLFMKLRTAPVSFCTVEKRTDPLLVVSSGPCPSPSMYYANGNEGCSNKVKEGN